MDLHICAIKYIKSCLMLCEHATNQENGTIKYYLRNVYVSRGSAGQVNWMHPLRISASMKAGVVGRDGCSGAVGPHRSKNRMQKRRRSRVSRAGCTHAQQVDKQLTELQTLAWRSPPMAIADVHHTCHIKSGQCTRKHKCTASPSPQFACPQ